MAGVPDPVAIDLAELFRREGSAILQRWEERVRRTTGPAQQQSRSALLDHVPALLATIAKSAEQVEIPHIDAFGAGVTGRHAAERLQQGFGLAEVVLEYVELRSCIFERLEELNLVLEPQQSRRLHAALDHALRETARRYMSSHDKMLRAMDQLVGERSNGHSLGEVLDNILGALSETAGAEVDSVVVLLVGDDGRLHVRAAIGLETELDQGFSVAVGEGFAGRIAETGQPLLLRDAANDALVVSEWIRKRGTRALYGVPLRDGDRTIGVAHIGSRTAFDFSDEDMMLFRAMADRATTAIMRAQFIETLERTARFREQFIGVLGHDLRAPLSTIVGSAQYLLEQVGEISRDRLDVPLKRILRTGKRMDELITHVLDFARARLGGGIPLKPSPVDLLALVHEIVDEHMPMLGKHTLDVIGEELHGTWDRERLTQVIQNLLMNAVQHSPPTSPIRIRVARDGACATLSFWNLGTMPHHPQTFEPFERMSDKGGGLGLGLFIAQAIVSAHDGSLKAHSDETGTTFTVRLPL